MMPHEQIAMFEYRRHMLLDLLGKATFALSLRIGRRTPTRQFRGLGRQAFADAGEHVKHRPGQFLEDMEAANLVRHAGEHLGKRFWVQRGAVYGDAANRIASRGDALLESGEKTTDVRTGGVMTEYGVQEATLLGAIHR